jgi:choline dehydrogenase
MLSGLGSYEELEKHSITGVRDLPGVGKNLKDHLTVNLSVLLKDHHQTFKEKMNFLSSIKELSRYLFANKGLYTYPAADVGVFFKSSLDKERPDAQVHFAPGAGKYHKNGKMSPESGITASVTILRPKSSGSVAIASANPKDAPLIDPNYLSADEDLVDLRNAIKITREILSSSPIKEEMIREILPGEDIQTDNALDQFIQQTGLSVYHPVGTCKMGFDEMSVVDNFLKVWGIKNLRVADLSIAPDIISGNTNALGNVIGAKCADAILKAN